MQWSLEDIYKKQVRGKIPPRRHLRVLGEGTSEEHNINKRNDVGYKDPETGQWKFARASNKFIKDIMAPSLEYSDSSSYLSQVLKRGIEAGIIGEDESINSWKVKKLYDYIKSSVGSSTVPAVLKGLPDPGLQAQFKENIKQGIPFNFYDLINSKLGTDFQYDKSLDTMRPAGEDQKTRGAAGPGEALLAFLYNGSKPQEAGDLQLGDDMIELKKIQGRIGKDVDVSRVRELQSLFYPLRGKAESGRLREDKEGGYSHLEKWKGKTLGQFIEYYSGVSGSAGPGFEEDAYEWLKTNNKAAPGKGGESTYARLIQWVAAMQMREYFSKIADFNYLVVFEPSGRASGFSREQGQLAPRDVVEMVKRRGIHFGNKEDKDGHQIFLQK